MTRNKQLNIIKNHSFSPCFKIYFALVFVLFTKICVAQSFEVKHIETPLEGNVFCPIIYDSRLVVCSDQKNSIFITVQDKHKRETVDLFFINPKDKHFEERFMDEFKTPFHDGPIAINQAKNFIVISRNLKTDINFKYSLEDENPTGIFFSTKYGNNWSDIEPFEFNSTEYNISHPTLNKKGTTVYFTSNMPGGFGGYDLYKSNWEGDKWSKPTNLGPDINSVQDELFPSFINDKIYFSSNRGEFGGLDIYQYDPTNSILSILDTNINSEHDDFGIVSADSGEEGYFSSNRSGKDQIYSFQFNYPEFNNCDSLIETYFCYTLADEYAFDLPENSGLIYVWNVNNEKLYGTSVDYCFEKTGDYEITLDIVDTIVNQTFFEQSYIFLSIQYEEQPYINCSDSVDIGKSFTINAEKSFLPGVDIKNEDYYWSINEVVQKRGFQINHEFDSAGIYKIQVGVIGTQDGQQIKDCTYKYVVCTNPKKRIETPHADLLKVGKKSNDQVKIQRKDTDYADPQDSTSFYTIEIIVSEKVLPPDDLRLKLLDGKYEYRLSFVPEKNIYLYHIGEYLQLNEAHQDWIDLKNLGLDNATLRTLNYSDGAFELNELFVLENINFRSNEWEILDESMPDLNKVVQVMNILKDFNLQVNAHTDNTASKKYNLELSQKRAQSIKNYLELMGVEPSRIKANGFGESKPIASNDNEEGKAQNRRVEFRLNNPRMEQ